MGNWHSSEQFNIQSAQQAQILLIKYNLTAYIINFLCASKLLVSWHASYLLCFRFLYNELHQDQVNSKCSKNIKY